MCIYANLYNSKYINANCLVQIKQYACLCFQGWPFLYNRLSNSRISGSFRMLLVEVFTLCVSVLFYLMFFMPLNSFSSPNEMNSGKSRVQGHSHVYSLRSTYIRWDPLLISSPNPNFILSICQECSTIINIINLFSS